MKRLWQPTDDCKTVPLPRLNGTRIAADDTVELHRPEAAPARPLERVIEHGSCDAATLGFRCSDVTAVRNVRAASALVGAQVIGPQDASAILRHERFVVGPTPVFDRILFRNVSGNCVCFSSTKYGFQDGPDFVRVVGDGQTDRKHENGSSFQRVAPF